MTREQLIAQVLREIRREKPPRSAPKRQPLKRGRAVYVKLQRAKDFLRWAIEHHHWHCWVCQEPISPTEFDEWRDTVTLHHVDLNHANDHPANKVVVHRSCHRSFHERLKRRHRVIGVNRNAVKATKQRVTRQAHAKALSQAA